MIDIIDTKDEVAWDEGFINWDGVEKSFKEGTLSLLDFNNLVEKIAKRYSKDAEAYYSGANTIAELEGELDDKDDAICDLEDEIEFLEEDVERLKKILQENGIDEY